MTLKDSGIIQSFNIWLTKGFPHTEHHKCFQAISQPREKSSNCNWQMLVHLLRDDLPCLWNLWSYFSGVLMFTWVPSTAPKHWVKLWTFKAICQMLNFNNEVTFKMLTYHLSNILNNTWNCAFPDTKNIAAFLIYTVPDK